MRKRGFNGFSVDMLKGNEKGRIKNDPILGFQP
jgi:hypothetical protein